MISEDPKAVLHAEGEAEAVAAAQTIGEFAKEHAPGAVTSPNGPLPTPVTALVTRLEL